MGCGTSGIQNNGDLSASRAIPLPPSAEERLHVVIEAETDIGGKNKKENQDVFLTHDNFMDEPSRRMFGVMDGHGADGARAAQFCRQALPSVLEAVYDGNPDPANMCLAMRTAFIETDARVSNRAKSRCNATHSGTTATVVLMEHRELLIGWAGDSQAMIIQEMQPGNLQHVWISRAHQFSYEDEKQRVLKSGGWVDQSRSNNGLPAGPLRAYFKGQGYPGLMVSRSLGDSDAHSIGVSAEPECFHITLSPEDRYVVVCSDGVWDVLSQDDVTHIIGDHYGDLRTAVKQIVSRAKSEWAHPCHNGRVDNITAVAAMIRFPEHPTRAPM